MELGCEVVILFLERGEGCGEGRGFAVLFSVRDVGGRGRGGRGGLRLVAGFLKTGLFLLETL